MTDTIFALSSGSPPAAIAIIRVSGPAAAEALRSLSRRVPPERRATVARLYHPQDGIFLDQAVVLWLPGPATATGEDIAELHLHGGRAVIAAVEAALAALPGLRPASPGEFTRRAFANGRLDLAEAEGLADLLAAETELQRRAASEMSSGALSRPAEAWRLRVLELSAAVEAMLDFGDEDDAAELPESFVEDCGALASAMEVWLSRPRAEALQEGFTVVLAGPPNAGKSTLFNALTDSEAAITSPHPGTTRDLIVRTVAIEGVPFRFVDTAGLREQTDDPIEVIGISRARSSLEQSDLVLWLGPAGHGPSSRRVWEVAPRQDLSDATVKPAPSFAVSAATGAGMAVLRAALLELARSALPMPGEAALNRRQHDLISECAAAVGMAGELGDALLVAENLRRARSALDHLVGRAGVEDMLDSLFGRFCIGK